MQSIPLMAESPSNSEVAIMDLINKNVNASRQAIEIRLSRNHSAGGLDFSRNEHVHALSIDALYFSPVSSMSQSTAHAELWLTSSTSTISVDSFLKHASYKEILVLVTHLDPIVQSTFFRKTLSFFPQEISAVLSQLNAIHYPEVLSLRDAYFQHWGDGNCTSNVFKMHT